MTALTQSTKRKLSLLQLAEELGNVSRACKVMGYHRDTFHEVNTASCGLPVATLITKSAPVMPSPIAFIKRPLKQPNSCTAKLMSFGIFGIRSKASVAPPPAAAPVSTSSNVESSVAVLSAQRQIRGLSGS